MGDDMEEAVSPGNIEEKKEKALSLIIKKENEKEEEPEEIHLKTKTIPAVIMLLGGAATSIMCFISKYALEKSLWLIFGSLLLFLIIGGIVKYLLDKIVIIPKEPENEDTVIERRDDTETKEEDFGEDFGED